MSDHTSQDQNVSDRMPLLVAAAAISMAESLMLTLIDKGLLSKEDVEDAMRGAIDSHLHAEPSELSSGDHRDVANVLQRMLAGANSVRAAARL